MEETQPHIFDLDIKTEVGIQYYSQIPGSLCYVVWQIAKVSTKRAESVRVTDQTDLGFVIVELHITLEFDIREARFKFD